MNYFLFDIFFQKKKNFQFEFFLSLVGFMVGVGNTLKFPSLAYQHGGGKLQFIFFMFHLFSWWSTIFWVLILYISLIKKYFLLFFFEILFKISLRCMIIIILQQYFINWHTCNLLTILQNFWLFFHNTGIEIEKTKCETKIINNLCERQFTLN